MNPSVISKSLLDYIKLVERNIKISKSCESILRNENLVFEISGYLSYFRSFTLLFDDQLVKKDYKFAQSVFKSLKSTVAKRKNKMDFSRSFKTSSYTALGLFISINVLINGFWGPTLTEVVPDLTAEDRIMLAWSSGIIIAVFWYLHIKCKISAYFYYNNYNLFEFSKLIKKGRLFRIGAIGLFCKFIPILFYLAFLYFLFLNMQNSV